MFKRKKFWTVMLVILVCSLSFAVYVTAAVGGNTDFSDKLAKIIALNIGKADALITGQDKKIDDTNQEVVPFIEENRTYVPVRFVSEGLGATVSWDAGSQTVNITSSNTHISLVIGQKNMLVNDKQVEMDASARIRSGRTFVPVRYIAEALGKKVYFENGLIAISSSDITIDATADKQLVSILRDRITNSGKSRQGNNFQRADLMGVIDSISGQEITLKLIELPQFSGTGRQNDSTGNVENSTEQPAFSRQRQGTSRTSRPAPNFTGENKTITLSAEAKITTTVRTDQGRENKDLQISDLNVGDTLSIWYSDKATETISKITVRQQQQGQ